MRRTLSKDYEKGDELKMKTKLSIVILFVFLCIPAFAQKQIGKLSQKNILFVTAVNDKPVYAYYEIDNKSQRQYYLSYNNTLYGPYLFIRTPTDFFENRIALSVDKKEGSYIFINGKEYGPHSIIYMDGFISDTEYSYHTTPDYFESAEDFSYDPDVCVNGKRLTDVTDIIRSKKGLEAKVLRDKTQNKYYVEFDKNKYGPYDTEVTDFTFLSDEKTLIYTVVKNKENYFVINGKESGPYHQLGTIEFSSDKKHYAYFYEKDSKYTLVKDGNTIETIKDIFIDYNYFPEMPFLRFIPNTDEVSYIEYDKVKDEYNLKAGKTTYKDIDPYSVIFVKNSVIYVKAVNYNLQDAYIDGKLVQQNVIRLFPFMNDKNDYAYIGSKKVSLSMQPGYYYGSMDEDDDDIMHADCLFYKNKEYLLPGYLTYAFLLNKKDLLYVVDQLNSTSFYLNEKLVQTFENYGDKIFITSIKSGNDYLSFTLNEEEAKIYYNEKIYPGSATENQLVYVDKGNVYLKKY